MDRKTLEWYVCKGRCMFGWISVRRLFYEHSQSLSSAKNCRMLSNITWYVLTGIRYMSMSSRYIAHFLLNIACGHGTDLKENRASIEKKQVPGTQQYVHCVTSARGKRWYRLWYYDRLFRQGGPSFGCRIKRVAVQQRQQ